MAETAMGGDGYIGMKMISQAPSVFQELKTFEIIRMICRVVLIWGISDKM
jgi:hypothetical protein